MDETPTEEIKAEEVKTEEAAGVAKAPEPEQAAATPAAPPPVESPPAPPRSPSKQNWMLIALIAVSVIALLLLATTICLAVVGEGRFHRGGERFEKSGQRNWGPMMNRDGGGWRGCPWLQKNQNGKVQPPLPTPTPTPQTQPTPPSGQSP